MRIAWIMLKKETVENIRKSRFFVIGIVFVLFAITSPLTAKYLPEIVSFLLNFSDDALRIPIEFPEPTVYDSYIQWYKNLSQMGILVLIFAFMGMVSDEKSSGSVILVLTKAVPRHTFILMKYLSAAVVLFVTLITSFFVFYYYTFVLFDQRPALSAFTGLFLFYLFSLFILAVTLFSSTLSKKTSISALIALSGYFAMSILSALPFISDYFPTRLTQAAYEISAGVSDMTDFSRSIFVAIAAIVLLNAVSIMTFKKQEL
jgi:ABC-2 type transport system permease protein